MKNFYTNKYCLALIYLLFVSVFSVNGQTYIPAGNVTETWQFTNSPYYIQGEITIPNGKTLTIEPGVEIIFTGHYKLNVQGRLLAMGTKKDTIRFTAEDKNIGWHGIRFLNTPETNDTSKIVYCSFKYGNANTGSGLDRCGGAILISRFDKVLVSNCLFDSNKQSGEGWSPPEASPAIYIYFASPIVRNSTFTKNKGSKGSAVGCISCPNAIVSNNIFLNNSGAFGPVVYASNSNGTISGNIIANNTFAYNSAPSGGGIYCQANSDPIFINNILYGNSATAGSQIYLLDNNSDPIFTYCDIQGGKEEFGGTGAGTNYTGVYENNIDSDPFFADTASMNFSLSESSHCIGAGIDSVEVLGKWYHTPKFGINGNPRPSPAGTNPDMGAYESLLATDINQYLLVPEKVSLEQNYPNPFNSNTKIKYSISKSSNVTLKVFDIHGKVIDMLVNEEKPAGSYEVIWFAGNLPGGVYFYRLNAGGVIETRKMILHR